MNDIDTNGYIILKHVLTDNDLQFGLSSDDNGIINYNKMKLYIDNYFFAAIKRNTNFIKDPAYIKFRYNNNNNSTDAATFHSDTYNFTESETFRIYTCLCYFDKTQLELIPGSHKKQFHKENTVLSSYSKKQVITVEPGDIVIFHSNLYHRGTNFNTTKNRRVLQVFDVFPDKDSFNENFDKLITVRTSDTKVIRLISNVSYNMAKFPFIIDNANFIHYFLVYNNLQYKIVLNDISPQEKKNKLITYESAKNLDYEMITEKDAMNLNIICKKSTTIEPGYYYLFYFIFCVLFLFIIYYVIKVLLFDNKNQKIKKYKGNQYKGKR